MWEVTMAEWIKRFSLTGKKAVVTGATKGIGFETCKVLADAGADIAAIGRDDNGLEEVVRAVKEAGRNCVAIKADLSKSQGAIAAAQEALKAFGTIDILVNNAGIALIDDLLIATAEDWDKTMAVNLRAPFLLAREIVPGMIMQKSGKIINISSQAGVVGLQSHGAYAASKGGLNMLTKVMTVEWAKHNIQINSVCPTVILTPMGEQVWGQPEKGDPMKAKIPSGRFGKPIEVADMILYLASSASDMVCGQDFMIDGGYTAI
jgi:NAD(P)-dependent dehydrogenase (short-subunit alcohol dehydrogenase family)